MSGPSRAGLVARSCGRAPCALAALALLCALATTARAHPMDIGYLRVDARGVDVDVALDLDVAAAATLLAVPVARVDRATVAAQAGALALLTFAAEPMRVDGGACAWQPARASLTGKTVRISSVATCSVGGERVLPVPFVRATQISDRFQLLVQQRHTGSDELALVDRTSAEIVIGEERPVASFVHFIGSGIAHIGAAPSEWRDGEGDLQLPDGIDHILFLLGLLLGGGTLLKMLGVATGFTVGHSITLALAATGVVHPPGWIIEPLIALSIAFVAIEALTQRLAAHRWKIALGFGLVHGFGFANALTELHLETGALVKALFGYNLGVELGQLALVMVLAPVVLAAHRRRWAQRWAIRPAAIVIGIAGMYWFIQRVAG